MRDAEEGQVNVRMNLVGAEEATASVEGLTSALNEAHEAANGLAAALGRLSDVLASFQSERFDVTVQQEPPINWPTLSEDDVQDAADELARRRKERERDA